MFRTVTLAAILLGAAAPAAANIIVNGDFETAGSSGTVPAGWTLNTGGNPQTLLRLDGNFYAQYGATGTTAALDNHFLTFGAYDSPNATDAAPYDAPYIEQSFQTVAGQRYDTSFNVTAFGAYTQGYGAYLFADGYLLNYDPNSVEPTSDLDLLIQNPHQSFSFLGTGGVMTIRFTNRGITTSSDLFLDNVVIEASAAAVPEPATWAMMIAGFGLVGGGMRRRTAKIVAA